MSIFGLNVLTLHTIDMVVGCVLERDLDFDLTTGVNMSLMVEVALSCLVYKLG